MSTSVDSCLCRSFLVALVVLWTGMVSVPRKLVAEEGNRNSANLQSLLNQVRRVSTRWPEGRMTCEVNGAVGNRKFDVAWAGSNVRYEFYDDELSGGPDTGDIMIRTRTSRVHFSPRRKRAIISSRAERPSTSSFYNVLPNDLWLEVRPSVETVDWIRQQTSRKDVAWVCERTERKGYQLQLSIRDDPETAFEVEFARSGVPLQFGPMNRGTREHWFAVTIDWESAATNPVPKRYRRLTFSKAHSPEPTLVMEVIVSNFASDAGEVQFRVPPDNLPFGTRISDRRGESDTVTYVGGELGSQEFRLRQAAEFLKGDEER